MHPHSVGRRIRIIAAAAVLALAAAGIAAAKPAAPPASPAALQAQLTWRTSLLAHQIAEPGCFEAHYPDKLWHKVACVAGPAGPVTRLNPVPTLLYPTGQHTVTPNKIGGGAGSDTDYMATVDSGHVIQSATGSFSNVTGLKTLSSSSGADAPFSLQINTEQINNIVTPTGNSVPECGLAPYPNICQGWEQFVYLAGNNGDPGKIYIQDWALHYLSKDCPDPWVHYDGPPESCFFTSAATAVPNQPLANFGKLVLSGAAANGGQDMVTLIAPTGMYTTHAADNVFNLAKNWTQAEFNVFGGANSSQANFNAGVSLGVHLAASMFPPEPLGCATQSTTGESTNVFIDSPCVVAAAGNAIDFTESNGYYANGPLITGVSPGSVKATGGDPITITGLRLGNPASVTFNLLPVPYSTDPTKTNQITIPSAPACSPLRCPLGGAVVSVTGPAGPAGAHMTTTSYGGPITQTPNVLKVVPASGPDYTFVTVTGAGFYTPNGATPAFYFGSAPATNVTCSPNTPNTQCTMTVPPQTGSPNVSVSFGAPGGASMATWIYFGSANPTIASITPTHGQQAGGTQVTLTGTHFTQTMQAVFNPDSNGTISGCTTPKQCVYIGITGDCPTPTQCVFQTPRGQGAVSVSVQDYTTQLGSLPVAFTYDAPPPSGTLQPTGGPASGGTATEADLTSVKASAPIAIQFNFSTGAVPINGAVCQPNALNAANAYCTFPSPPLPAGLTPPVAVPVTVNVPNMTLQLGSFTYQAASPGSISPDTGPRTGGTNLTLHVNNLLAGPGAAVTFAFAGAPTAAPNAACTVDAGNTGNSTCTATTPPLPADDTTPIDIPVTVTAQGRSVTLGNFQYGHTLPPPSQCAICREQGGVCSTEGGKFVCTCQRSSPTGACQ
jgi:hypothetical protein